MEVKEKKMPKFSSKTKKGSISSWKGFKEAVL